MRVVPSLTVTREEFAAARDKLGTPVVLVPTMGALHTGHRRLLQRARELAGPDGTVVVSIFVNPRQFGPNEDFDRYPRTLDDDLVICGAEGASLVWAPTPAEVYPGEQMVTVDPGAMGQLLEGAFRPGFFNGVLTVVLKLFQVVRPDVAVFGEKDAQQLALVRRMVADLDLGVHIESVPTVRDHDGLAISSRNRYLSAAERTTALALSAALAAGQGRGSAGAPAVRAAATAVLARAATQQPGALTVDYLELVDAHAFTPVPDDYAGPATLAVAARVGVTRLIDNLPVAVDVDATVRDATTEDMARQDPATATGRAPGDGADAGRGATAAKSRR